MYLTDSGNTFINDGDECNQVPVLNPFSNNLRGFILKPLIKEHGVVAMILMTQAADGVPQNMTDCLRILPTSASERY